MRPQRRGAKATTFQVPIGFARDAKLNTVTFSAGFLFLAIVAVVHESNSNGRITLTQIADCARRLRNLKRYVAELCEAELLRYDKEEAVYMIVDTGKWLIVNREWGTPPETHLHRTGTEPELNRTRSGPVADLNGTRSGPRPGPKRNRTRTEVDDESAGQGDAEEVPRAQGWARADAGLRAGSFEVPSSSRTDGTPKGARDAPRVSGGAARPAPVPVSAAGFDHEEWTDELIDKTLAEGGTLPRAVAFYAAKRELQKGRAKNSAATGIDTKFSKYDPNRPIEPITSAMVWEAEPE